MSVDDNNAADGTTTAGEEHDEFCVIVGPVIRTAGILTYTVKGADC